MAQTDLTTYLRERMAAWDSTVDTSDGSPFDTQVLRPLLRRLGTDPYTTDLTTFVRTRMAQEFPDAYIEEGGGLADLLVTPVQLMLDPVVRETSLVKTQQSMIDPAVLTTDEAKALGANVFSEIATGAYARTTVRLYFANPRSTSVSPANYCSAGELRFLPIAIQSIRTEEMVFNKEGSLYYFDISVIAEKPGDQYNVAAGAINAIANLATAVRVTNKFRARDGLPAETSEQFIDRARQEVTERSLVGLRGIMARLPAVVSSVRSIAVVGMGDPEMQRDVLKGGGLGPVLAAGVVGQAVPDGSLTTTTRRFRLGEDALTGESPNLHSLIGPPGPVRGRFILTVFGGFATSPQVRDLSIVSVVPNGGAPSVEVDVVDSVLLDTSPVVVPLYWMLRRSELTLSDIPGGILFPEGEFGLTHVDDDVVHIGGAYDVYCQGAEPDEASLTISTLSDETPLLSGARATTWESPARIYLNDYTLGTNYEEDDAHYLELERSVGRSITIPSGVAAGVFRILRVVQPSVPDDHPYVEVDPAPFVLETGLMWSISDEVDVDLVEPKFIRLRGSDLSTVQGSATVTTLSGTDMSEFGVAAKDILRVHRGPDAGDYTVRSLGGGAFFTEVVVDRPFKSTTSHVDFTIFKLNPSGGVVRPLLRVKSVELLDATGQPVGSTVPYACPVDGRSTAFSNIARGVKAEVTDALLGIVGRQAGSGYNAAGLTLDILVDGLTTMHITLVGGEPISLSSIVSQINAVSSADILQNIAVIVPDGAEERLGLRAMGRNLRVTGGTAVTELFGAAAAFDSRHVRSLSITNWSNGLTIPLEDMDVVAVMDGGQVGFCRAVSVYSGVSQAVMTDRDFVPELRRKVRIGAPSLGSCRLFFLEPTTFEVDASATFTYVDENLGDLHYRPDPTLEYTRIPGPPSVTSPSDGVTTGVDTLSSSSIDFISKLVAVGDILSIDSGPIVGSVGLADPVPSLALKTLVLSIAGSSDKTITFMRDDPSIPVGAVTRAAVAKQINQAIGKTLATLGVGNHLELEGDVSIVVRASGSANALLGFSAVADTLNTAGTPCPNVGRYAITAVAPGALTCGGETFTAATRQHFRVIRPGVQRIVATDMAKNLLPNGLYWFDVELLSEGPGDTWNISAGNLMTATGYRSDGYRLSTRSQNLTFSTTEDVTMTLSPTILEVGTSDDPENATHLLGQGLQVIYWRSQTVADAQNFLSASLERVVDASPLARHLIVHMVRCALTYMGGSAESVVRPDILDYINGLLPDDYIEVSELIRLMQRRGAVSIENPIEIIAVVFGVDRSVVLERSQNKLSTGRLATFIPDGVTVTRRVA